MGLLKFLKPKPVTEEATYEITENHLSIDVDRYQVRIKKQGQEFYVEDFFQAAKKPRDLNFSRFFLLNEKPPKPHFAPSLQEALGWFRGRQLAKDGYGHIFWGDQAIYTCDLCRACREVPLLLTQVERLAVTTDIPTHREIVGWRVAEVESELTGRGTPTRRLEDHKLKPIIIWHQAPNRCLCDGCARKLAEAGRPLEAADYFIFEME